MKKRVAPKARKEDLVVQESDGEILIYDLNTNKAFCLNETSALIWQLCDGDRSASEISEAISRKFNSPVNEDFVWLALDQLKKENLIENKDEIAIDFDGMSRREVIRKVGLASVVALPLISSLVAPLAAEAQSRTCGGACICTNSPPAGSPCTFTATATCTATCVCTRNNNGNSSGTCST